MEKEYHCNNCGISFLEMHGNDCNRDIYTCEFCNKDFCDNCATWDSFTCNKFNKINTFCFKCKKVDFNTTDRDDEY